MLARDPLLRQRPRLLVGLRGLGPHAELHEDVRRHVKRVRRAPGDRGVTLRGAEAAQSEENLGVPSGPPDTFKPAHELYGELLLRAGKKKEAAEQFRIELTRTPNRTASVAGLAIAEQ